MGNLTIYVEMVRPSDVKNILRLLFPLVFKVALLFAEVRRGNISMGYITPNYSKSATNFFPYFCVGGQ